MRIAPRTARSAGDWFTSGVGGGRIRTLETHRSDRNAADFDAYRDADPDVIVVRIGVNDTIHADEASLGASRRSLRRTLRELSGRHLPTLLVGPNPVRDTHQSGPWFVADAYRHIHRALSLEFGIPLLETAARWGSYQDAVQRGYLQDQVHPTAAGHADIGEALADPLIQSLRHQPS